MSSYRIRNAILSGDPVERVVHMRIDVAVPEPSRRPPSMMFGIELTADGLVTVRLGIVYIYAVHKSLPIHWSKTGIDDHDLVEMVRAFFEDGDPVALYPIADRLNDLPPPCPFFAESLFSIAPLCGPDFSWYYWEQSGGELIQAHIDRMEWRFRCEEAGEPPGYGNAFEAIMSAHFDIQYRDFLASTGEKEPAWFPRAPVAVFTGDAELHVRRWHNTTET